MALRKAILRAAGREEAAPLLVAERHTPAPVLRTPLPGGTILILCILRVGEPIAFYSIYPFVSKMIEDLHLTDDPRRIGYFAGVIESLFALTTFLTVLGWGRLSDRIGRKPVMLIGLTGVSISVAAFGMSQSFTAMIVSRCLGGALNGNVAVIKSMLGEITDETNQGRAFSFLPLSWSIGSVIGPILGGFLSNPASNYPGIFGNNAFLQKYPYALPCFVSALFPAFGALVCLFFLDETLPSRASLLAPTKSLESANSRSAFFARTSTTIPVTVPPLAASGTSTPLPADGDTRPPPFSDLLTPTVFSVLTCYTLLALQTVALDALLILFCYTSISLGGLGFSEADIGKALACAGVLTVVSQVSLFPPLQHKFGTIKLYRGLMALYPFVFSLFPIMSHVASQDAKKGLGRTRVWYLLVVFLLLKAVANMSYATNMLAITDAAPSRRLLGSLNGVAQMCSSLARSIGPFAASSLFAYSIEKGAAGGELVFYLMIALAVGSAASTWLLSEGGARWREAAKNDEEEELLQEEGEELLEEEQELLEEARRVRGEAASARGTSRGTSGTK